MIKTTLQGWWHSRAIRGIKARKNVFIALALVLSMVGAMLNIRPATAAPSLTVEPITWNVIGLDSNNVNVGPNNFPVGARVCNTDPATAATNVTAVFVWDDGKDLYSGHPFINLRADSLSEITLATLTAGACSDFYFEVSVTRDSGAYFKTRRFHIDVTADGSIAPLSTPRPREIYVERLISQNRNSTLDVLLDGVSIPAGGTMTLMVGQTYTIKLIAKTATNGYEQIQSFINFPNTIFQVLNVDTTYTAETSPYMSPPYDMLYGNACLWENDPNSSNYRSCIGSGKAGGTVTVEYTVKIIDGGRTSQTLNSLIYDFSGASYHYNSDYSVGGRIAAIVDPSNLTIAKKFNPDPTNEGGVSRLTFTITNPNAAAVSGINFEDTFPASPGAMVVANPPNAATAGCGAPIFSPAAGASSIAFSDGTIAANGTCSVSVNVTVPVEGTYANVSDNLFVDDLDTGEFAEATLNVNNAPPPPACTPGLVLARWTMAPAQGTGTPPQYSFKASNVATAVARFIPSALPGVQIINTSEGNPVNSWSGTGWGTETTPVTAGPGPNTPSYFEFELDTSRYAGGPLFISIAVNPTPTGNWAAPRNITVNVHASADAAAFGTIINRNPVARDAWTTLTGSVTPGATTTRFRVNISGRSVGNANATFLIDNIEFTGCGVPDAPELKKSFSPRSIAVGGVSTLTFTATLSGVSFSDSLPDGVRVATNPELSNSCGGSVSGATAGSTSISLSGGSIAAGSFCTLRVDVTATTAGPHPNISGIISSAQTGTNTSSTGSASDTLTALLPPTISKLFAPNPILVGEISTLTFTITNPNQDDALTGVAFSDTYPGGLVNAAFPNTSTSCGGEVGAASGGTFVSFSGGTIPAGSICTVTTDVTATSTGSYLNTSNAVTAAVVGGTDTASDTLDVAAPAPGLSFLKQVGLTSDLDGAWSSFVAVALDQEVYYKFTVENTGDVALTSVGFTDPDLDPSACSWEDGDGTALPASFTLPVADEDEGHLAYCVLGPIKAASGWHPNTATADSAQTDAVPWTATYATTGLTLVKSANESSFENVGDTITYQYEVTNTGFASLRGPVTVTDDKTTATCPDVNTVGDADNFLDGDESIICTATYTVDDDDLAAGYVTNRAYATADGVDSDLESVTVNREGYTPAMSVSKSESSNGPYGVGDEISYEIVVANTGNVTLTGVVASDPGATLGVCTPAQPASLAPGASMSCAATYRVTQADIDRGSYTNKATADSDQTGESSASETVTFTPLIGVAKRVVSGPVQVSPGTWDVIFEILVLNYGNVTLNNIQVTDDLTTTFPSPTVFTVESLTSSNFSINPGYNGGADPELLDGSDSLEVGEDGTIRLVVRVVPASSGPFLNTAIASTDDDSAADNSQDGDDPDPDEDGDPTDNNDPTSIDFGPNLFDPPFGIKTVDGSGRPVLRWTMVWINDTNIVAVNARVNDPIPVGTAFVPIPGEPSGYAVPIGAPAGSTNEGVSCTAPTGSVTTTSLCYYEGPTLDYPRGRIIWEGSLGPDLGVTEPDNAKNAIWITFHTRANSGVRQVQNTATIDVDLNGDGVIDDSGEQMVATSSEAWNASPLPGELPTALPATGFAPGVYTAIAEQPQSLLYTGMGDLRLEIPSLRVNASIVGVPLDKQGWRLEWLGGQVGHLEGTAFPTWSGNSALTAHVYDANGNPGPFIDLQKMRWGQQIVVHGWGERYIYEVRSVRTWVRPDDVSVITPEQRSWLTLITCRGYDEANDSYRWRVVVRAVLMRVEAAD